MHPLSAGAKPTDDEPVITPVVKRPPGETRGTSDTPAPTDDLGSQVGTRDQSPDMNKRV